MDDEVDLFAEHNYPNKSTKAAANDEVDLFANYPGGEQSENLIKSVIFAPFRVGGDLATAGWHGLQKIPKLYEASKTEVPGLYDLAKNHKAHAAIQGLAGSQEMINNLNHIPVNLAEYANKRLHLWPKEIANFLKNITPDTTQAINELFDKPQYPGEKLLRGTVRNLPAIIPAGKALGSLRKLTPSNALRGNLTPEELANNLRITQGTETGLGDVIGNPFLKRLNENILSKIPGAGVNNSLQRTAGEVINRGHMLLDSISGTSEIENLDKYLNDALKASYKSHQTEKNALYGISNKIADDINLKLDLPNFINKVKEHKNAIEDTNIIKYEPEMQNLLRKIGHYENTIKT